VSNYYRGRRQTSRPVYNEHRNPRANKYAGPCGTCGIEVAAGGGILTGGPGNWGAKHLPREWWGSPVSGRWINGCPEATAELNGKADPEAGS